MFDVSAFLLVFGILFLAEIADKTQLAVIALAAEYKQPLKIALGASLGLFIVVLIGVLIGTAANEFIPEILVKVISALIFIVLGVWSLKETENHEKENESKEIQEERVVSPHRSNSFIIATLLVGGMEFGDKTQIATVSLTAELGLPLEVALGSTLAMGLLSFIGAYSGNYLQKHIPGETIEKGAAIIFIILGILILFEYFLL